METLATWAETEFGAVAVGDRRTTRRAVAMVQALGQQPDASLPRACGSWAALKSAYRLLHNPVVTRAALSEPHWQHTRQAADAPGVTLWLSDLTELDYTHYHGVTGLGEIGNGYQRGFHVHTTLAYRPVEDQVLGVAAQQTFRRQRNTHTRAQRRTRQEVESQVWGTAVAQIGSPPPGAQWVHVGDRAADIWPLFVQCLAQGTEFVFRVQQYQRQVWLTDEERLPVAAIVPHLPVVSQRQITITQRGQRPARTAQVQVATGAVTVPPPRQARGHAVPLQLWLVVVQEVAPPPEVEPLEWLLWTSIPTTTALEADCCIAWYRLRWLIEDYHQCLKTGCRMETRALHEADALERLLGMLGPLAAYLLSIRHAARHTPDAPATSQQPMEVVQVVAHLAHRSPADLTCDQFWQTIARRGGWLGRAGDGPPGWKTLWAGWQSLMTVLEGVHLVASLPPSTG